MLCKSCGEELVYNELRCRCCGAENEVASEIEQEQEIRELHNGNRILSRMMKKDKRLTWRIILLFAITAILFLAIPLAIYIPMALSGPKEDRKTTLLNLEALYITGDYAAMNELLQQTPDVEQTAYAKYSSVGDLFARVEQVKDQSLETAGVVAQQPEKKELLDQQLKELFEILRACNTLRENGFVYDEEDAVISFETQIRSLLVNTFLLTEEEIQQGVYMSLAADADYSDLRNSVADRLSGGES